MSTPISRLGETKCRRLNFACACAMWHQSSAPPKKCYRSGVSHISLTLHHLVAAFLPASSQFQGQLVYFYSCIFTLWLFATCWPYERSRALRGVNASLQLPAPP